MLTYSEEVALVVTFRNGSLLFLLFDPKVVTKKVKIAPINKIKNTIAFNSKPDFPIVICFTISNNQCYIVVNL